MLLNRRIQILQQDGQSLKDIPMCYEDFNAASPCPNGNVPASASQVYVDEREAFKAALSPPAAPALVLHSQSAGQAKAKAKLVAGGTLEDRKKKGFFSALQTPGSFTMMQAGGF